MSELITAENIDLVIKKNKEIKEEVSKQVFRFQMSSTVMQGTSTPQLAILILREFGLIQMPIEDKFWSGAIYVKDGKVIPVINTALPRANQYFTAWHELYHLMFDKVSFNHFIDNENMLEERKAEYFAASILLNGVEKYFLELSEMDFISKVFYCMSAFQVPYKAVLVSLYEFAIQSKNKSLGNKIKKIFDLKFEDMSKQFQKLGLDDSLVTPSYVVNTVPLQEKIRRKKEMNPELNYHKDNEEFLTNIIKEVMIIMRKDK